MTLENEMRETLITRAKEAAAHGTNPNVKIGAAVSTDTDDVYTGTIVETQDRQLGSHAERLAVLKAISEGAKFITAVAVYIDKPTPRICGSCRHIIYEFSEGRDPPIIMINSRGQILESTLSDLYPEPWLPHEWMFPRDSL